MGNLFGHKRWYEVRDKEDYKIRRKVKVKRNYDGNKYILNINENNNNKATWQIFGKRIQILTCGQTRENIAY